ncbi:MAG TPA: cysteine peptidase family C39 domain-containing protein [Polyangia bacterium]|nr:cysteine peptidase family C39 domain-containing protein [Polyangia bacterium]
MIQTSAMDCGPAALKCLLDGFGVGVSYGRLREACQTAVDGTSIDTLETLAVSLGLDAEQVMMPVDHLLLPEADALPAIVVTPLPSGLVHFVVVWRVHGAFVQIMDPARGRRWVRGETFLRDVYVHRMPVPAEAFREFAGSDAFTGPLARRLRALGVADGESLIARALEDPGWSAIAALDGAARTVAALMASGAVAGGAEVGRLVASLASAAAVPPIYATATAAPAAEDGTAQVTIRGAVLLRASAATPLDAEQRAALPIELRAAVEESRPRAGAELWRFLARDGRGRWAALTVGVVLAALGAVAEALLFRALIDLAAGRGSGGVTGLTARFAERFAERFVGKAPGGAPLGPGALVGAIVTLLVALLALELPLWGSLRRAGARLEEQLRALYLRKIPRLPDRYFQSRPVSDMAERAHLLHRLRGLPTLGGEIARTAIEIVVVTGGLAWLDPRGAGLAIALGLVALLVPFVAEPAVAERDLRMRNHAGALGRFYLDGLLGLVAVRTHGAEPALAREHRDRLREWVAAAHRALGAALTAEAAQTLLGLALAVRLLVGFFARGTMAGVMSATSVTSDPGTALLLVYWALSLPALGQELTALVQQIPAQRNLTLRLLEPLGAPEDDAAGAARVAPAAQAADAGALAADVATGVRVQLDDVRVVAGGHQILEVAALEIAPGEAVAIVGVSGAGKSSLVGLLLGWHRPATGTVRVDGATLDGAGIEALRRRTVWIDPAVYLWNRSLADNLAFGLAATPEGLGALLEEAELGEVVRRLPAGLATPLGEAGGLVSGGEGQRVRFGRGLLRARPRLVILDEPFRGLARDQRQALLARARRRWSSATMLCVTHDIAETAAFPRVLVVADGRIAEDGAPAVLLAQPGSRYAALAEAERRVRAAAWSAERWRRLRLEDRRVVEQPR